MKTFSVRIIFLAVLFGITVSKGAAVHILPIAQWNFFEKLPIQIAHFCGNTHGGTFLIGAYFLYKHYYDDALYYKIKNTSKFYEEFKKYSKHNRAKVTAVRLGFAIAQTLLFKGACKLTHKRLTVIDDEDTSVDKYTIAMSLIGLGGFFADQLLPAYCNKILLH